MDTESTPRSLLFFASQMRTNFTLPPQCNTPLHNWTEGGSKVPTFEVNSTDRVWLPSEINVYRAPYFFCCACSRIQIPFLIPWDTTPACHFLRRPEGRHRNAPHFFSDLTVGLGVDVFFAHRGIDSHPSTLLRKGANRFVKTLLWICMWQRLA